MQISVQIIFFLIQIRLFCLTQFFFYIHIRLKNGIQICSYLYSPTNFKPNEYLYLPKKWMSGHNVFYKTFSKAYKNLVSQSALLFTDWYYYSACFHRLCPLCRGVHRVAMFVCVFVWLSQKYQFFVVVFFHEIEWVGRVLRILNLERHPNWMIDSKVTTILDMSFVH